MADRLKPLRRLLANRALLAALLAALLGAGALGYMGLRAFLDQRAYSRGHEAYRQADCTTALAQYDQIAAAWRPFDPGGYPARAAPERDACQAYQDVVDEMLSGNLSAAALGFQHFVREEVEGPLVSAAWNNVEFLFQDFGPGFLASPALCQEIGRLRTDDLIPNPDLHVPPLYLACGQLHEAAGRATAAIGAYERLLAAYPDHPLASEAESALARMIVDQGRSTGAAELPAPQRTGSTESGVSTVIIQNSSPERLRIAFSGPEGRVEQLEPCETCERFNLFAPSTCPDEGSVGSYRLAPGEYDVLVEAISSPSTNPWSGTWGLEGGAEYDHCFFIVTTFGP